MLATMINIITAPGETMDSIIKEFNWKKAMMPVVLLMVLATFSGFILSLPKVSCVTVSSPSGIMGYMLGL